MEPQRKAFTVIELICVIAIIALLAALLMPTLSRSREVATRVVCASYMRGYGSAGNVYLRDHDGCFPAGPEEWLYTKASDTPDHPLGCRWHDLAMAPGGEIMKAATQWRGVMWDLIAETGIGPCPIFRDLAPKRGCENPGHKPEISIKPQFNYSINGYLGSQREGGVLKVSEVRDPAIVFFFGEENSWTLRPDHPKYPASRLSAPLSTTVLDDTVLLITPTPQAQDCFATFHETPKNELDRGFGNVVFIDGHVDMIQARQQLRRKMHGFYGAGRVSRSMGKSFEWQPAGNLYYAWASKSPPPGGWNDQ